GDPRSPPMQATMNQKIKFRESFRPFAPAVLRGRAHEWFDLPAGCESPYMLLVAPVRDKHRTALTPRDRTIMNDDPDLCRRVGVVRFTVPAVTHVDYSARVQMVNEDCHPRFARLLEQFERRTGCAMLVNTSFNVRGEPIVCTPRDAYRCFQATGIDALVLGDHVLHKSDRERGNSQERQQHLAQFQPD